MLVIRTRDGARLHVAPSRETQLATPADSSATGRSAVPDEIVRTAAPVLKLRAQPILATGAQPTPETAQLLPHVAQSRAIAQNGAAAEYAQCNGPARFQVALPRTRNAQHSAAAARLEALDERAALMEHCAGWPREVAEREALICEARRVLRWTDADVQEWLGDLERNAAWAKQALRECIGLGIPDR